MIQELITEAKGHGFTVYGPENLTTYFYFTDGEKIGYCQADPLCGPKFCTVNKPCQQVGTGFAAKSFDEALSFAPPWAYSYDRAQIVKYKNWQEFARQNWQPLTQY